MIPELDAAMDDYVELFGVEPPIPYGVSDERLTRALTSAIQRGQPLPDDYDFWDDLPDGAMA